MKILFAVDGSAACLRALDALIARLGWFAQKPSLHLVYVHPAVPYARAVAYAGKERVQGHYDEDAEVALKPAREQCSAKGVGCEAVKLVGEAAPEIVRHAAESGYDLVAMGTRGHNAVATLIIGSVAQKVIATSTVPVLLLR